MKKISPKSKGVGVGLRTNHFPYITKNWPKMDWFEAVTENFMDTGGRPLAILEKVRAHYPIALHGTSLSIGSTDPLRPHYMKNYKALVERIDPFLVSDHLCWTCVEKEELHDLLPLPFTEEALKHVVEKVEKVQNFLGRQMILENVSSYITYKHSVIPEWEFLREVARRSGCGILLDINNVYVNSFNQKFDPMDFLKGIPGSKVRQFHLAGHTDMGKFLFDTHTGEIIDPVWKLYEKALELVRKLNDPRKEQQELKAAIEQANYKSIDEMKSVSVEFKITEKEKNDFIASVFVEDNIESLERIGGLPNLRPSFKGARELTAKLAKDYPLQHIFGMSLIQQGRKIHQSSGGMEITEDHVVEQYSRNMRTYSIFSKFLFDELKKRGITGKQIADFLRDKEVFQYDNFGAIEEGLQNYDDGKYYSSLAVILPQIEEALRNLLRKAHLPTLTIGRTGDQVVIGMRDILESSLLKQAMTEDLYWYLRLILWDKRGPALRDNICHGLLSYKSGEYECYYVLHILLILAGFGLNQNNQEDKSKKSVKQEI